MGIVFQGDPNNGGWLKMVLSWDWAALGTQGFPGWERFPDAEMPLYVDLTIRKGTDKSSRDRAISFDDVSEGRFYYRDWTSDSLPFVDDGEVYRSAFWFEKRVDYERFVREFA